MVNVLLDIDVCQICLLRFTFNNYVDHPVDNAPVKNGTHCGACLGILEDHSLTSVAQDVAEKLAASNYDSPTFQLGISVPQCLVLRHAAVIAHLTEKGRLMFHRECSTVKSAARSFLVRLIEKLCKKVHDPHSELKIKLEFIYADDAKEISAIHSLLEISHAPVVQRNLRGKMVSQFKTNSIQRLVRVLPNSSVKKYTPCPPSQLSQPCECDVYVKHSSIFIGGRYNQFTRASVTSLLFTDNKKEEISTLGEKLRELTRGSEFRLNSSGREDADVRILGNGQPFAVEIVNPKKPSISDEEMTALQSDVNFSEEISVSCMQMITKSELDVLRKGEREALKKYRGKLWCREVIPEETIASVNSMKEIYVEQRTPIQLLHVRSSITRSCQVVAIHVTRNETCEYYDLEVTLRNGTHLKEFVHGDLGRTEPSLSCIMGAPVTVTDLDLIDIDINWLAGLEREKDKGASL